MANTDTLSRRALIAGASATALAGGWPLETAFAKAPMRNTPAPGFYRFKVGAFEVTVVSDGPLNLGPPSADLFKGLSNHEVVQVLTNNYLPTDAIKVEQNVVVINTGSHLVLIDTGIGPTLKVFGAESGRLLANLRAAGIEPAAVDTVLITHAHPDHCFGLMSAKATRLFPGAQIYLTQADFEFFTDQSKAGINDMMKTLIDGARQNLLPNRDRIVFIKDGKEVVSGIQAMLTPGHTVGHTSLMITSQGQSLFNTGDVCHHHIISTEKPRVPFAFDTDGQQGVASRLRVFDMLASTRTPMLAYHFPWPGVGFIGKQGDGDSYRYFPAPIRGLL